MDDALYAELEEWPAYTTTGAPTNANIKMHKYVVALVAVVKAQKEEIKKMAQKIVEMEAKQNKDTTTKPLTFAAMINDKKPNESTMVIMANVNRELSEKDRIQCNVVIPGAGYSPEDADTERVNKVLEALKSDRGKVKSQRRIKPARTNSSSAAPMDKIVVTFNSVEDKQKALRNSKLLKDIEGMKNVYINPDKTQSERLLERNLRQERNNRNQQLQLSEGRLRYGIKSDGPNKDKKFYWGIRWGAQRNLP